MYDFVREANIAMDKGEFQQGDVAPAQEFLASFDKVFAFVEDNDAEKLKNLGYADWDRRLPATRRSKNLSPSARRRASAATLPPAIASVKNSPIVV